MSGRGISLEKLVVVGCDGTNVTEVGKTVLSAEWK